VDCSRAERRSPASEEAAGQETASGVK
jgi:hypothetical protein